jgi:DNA-binding XRE family transcriptional regulator
MVHAQIPEPHAKRVYPPRRELPADVAGMVATARRRRGWGVREAARRIGVSPGTIVHLEKGRRAPSVIVAENIIDAYRLPDESAEMLLAVAVTDAGRSSPFKDGW